MNARKVDVLGSAHQFCDLVAAARSEKFPGHWSGSAFQSHPCGVIDGKMKLTNEWHVCNYCSIQITDGSGWGSDYSRDSFGTRDPHPKPVDGGAVTVWANGKWAEERFREALEGRVVELIGRIQEHVKASTEARKRDKDAERQRYVDAREALVSAALANIGSTP